jgi:RNA polymerase sigma factor (sigma-70 family)
VSRQFYSLNRHAKVAAPKTSMVMRTSPLRPDDAAKAQELAAAVRAALVTLTPREHAILAARHGLDGEPPRTLQEIGQHLGLTRERVRQIEARALRQLQHPTLRRWLDDAADADDDTPAAS